jgi:mRNA interferase MazF
MSIKRGDLFWVDLDPVEGSEQAGRRPVLVIQNDIGNEFSPTVIIAPLTTRSFTREYPTNVRVPKSVSGLKEDSTALLSQIRTVDKKRLGKKIGHLSGILISKIDQAIKISLGLPH